MSTVNEVVLLINPLQKNYCKFILRTASLPEQTNTDNATSLKHCQAGRLATQIMQRNRKPSVDSTELGV